MTVMATLEKAAQLTEKRLQQDIGEAKALATRAKELAAEAKQLEARAESLEQVIGVLNSFADLKQQEIQSKIEQLVTHGLQSIFSDDLTFHIVQAEKARRVETTFVIRSAFEGETIETSIMDARGGGVAAVAGFLLRLIIILLRKDTRHFLLLDESFSMVSDHYEAKLVEFVRELVDKTSIQIVLITHKSVPEWLAVSDRAYELSLKKGKTVAKDISSPPDFA